MGHLTFLLESLKIQFDYKRDLKFLDFLNNSNLVIWIFYLMINLALIIYLVQINPLFERFRLQKALCLLDWEIN